MSELVRTVKFESCPDLYGKNDHQECNITESIPQKIPSIVIIDISYQKLKDTRKWAR